MRNRLLLSILAVLLPMAAAAQQKSADQVHFAQDIYVQPGDKTGDLVCIGCSIHLRGQTAGDIVAIGGSVTLETGAQAAGGITTVVGDVRLQNGAQVAGDVVSVGGTVRRDPQATISGDVTSLAGTGWAILIVLFPLLMLGGFITLIVWLLRRGQPATSQAAYAGGQANTRS